MFCPGCGAEYDPGVTVCGECQVALVEEAPDFEPHFQNTVCVFESPNQSEIAMAESLLQGAEIPYVVQNEQSQGLIGAIVRESIFARIEVKPEFVDAASELLADLNEGVSGDDIDEFYDDEDDEEFGEAEAEAEDE